MRARAGPAGGGRGGRAGRHEGPGAAAAVDRRRRARDLRRARVVDHAVRRRQRRARVRGGVGRGRGAARPAPPEGHRHRGWVVGARDPIVVEDVAHDPRFAADIARGTGYVPQSIMAAPLLLEDRVLGVLSILDRPKRASLSLVELDLLGLFAHQAAVALELFEAARRAEAALDGERRAGLLGPARRRPRRPGRGAEACRNRAHGRPRRRAQPFRLSRLGVSPVAVALDVGGVVLVRVLVQPRAALGLFGAVTEDLWPSTSGSSSLDEACAPPRTSSRS